ncbi:MAG: hypothetical protein AUJ12_02015 [Alphaproteobacteria bacterium CG1_02_46_17]|nr:MAG: hypothetical protein AUJ12_02015 [Alphaproteobacteria bacterium CG1_02_46_17]
MIGPHEGKELDLMLKGEKSFAMFHDIENTDQNAPEEIIPEKAFSPHVKSGKIIRKEKSFKSNKSDDLIKYVCFALPDQVWRIDTFFWIKEEFFNGNQFPDDADDIIIGRMLGYSNQDIIDFLSPKR